MSGDSDGTHGGDSASDGVGGDEDGSVGSAMVTLIMMYYYW